MKIQNPVMIMAIVVSATIAVCSSCSSGKRDTVPDEARASTKEMVPVPGATLS
jgi:hypothetical protein